MESDGADVANVHYFIREKYYGTALFYSEDALDRRQQDTHLILLKAYCLSKLGKIPDAIRILNTLKKNTEVELAVVVGLRVAYSSEAVVDRESLKDVDAQINVLWTSPKPAGAYLASLLLTFEGTYDRARSLLDQIISTTASNAAFLAQRGWVDVLSKRDSKSALRNFESALRLESLPDAFLGKAKIFEQRHNSAEMKTTLHTLLDAHPRLLAGHVELMNASAMTREWERVIEIAQNASLIQIDCSLVQLYECAHVVLVNGEHSYLDQVLNDIYESITKFENTNAFVNYQLARFLYSISVDNAIIAQFAKRFIDKAIFVQKHASYLALKSRLVLAEGDAKTAHQLAMDAVKTSSDSNPDVLFAPIRVSIHTGDVADAKAQIEFIRATHDGIETTTLYYFYQALIAKTDRSSSEMFLGNMRSAIDTHLSTLQRVPFGLQYLQEMDLNFLIEVVMHLYDAAPLSPTRSPDPVLKEIERVLVLINENCPGVSRVCYLLGKAKYLSDDIRAAELLLRTCISKNSGVAEAHLLMAQIHVQNQDLEEAAKCLDVGLSFNFKVRDHPLYFLTKARLMKRTKQVEQSVVLLKSALDLPVFTADRKSGEKTDISESDKIAVYLELIDSLQLLGRTAEADALMGNALDMYSGKAEEQQLVLVNAQLRLQRGDVDGAFNILQTVTPDQPNYQAARMKMAQIYLEEKHDKHKFAACYRDILEKDPSPQAYVLLGDAYMSIQEPNNAIEAYETAMRRNPKDSALAEKIGNAYVQCHLYHKAINFYEAAMKSGRQNVLRLNFADQLFLMGNYEKCERVLREVLDEESEPSDVSAIKDHVQYWLLLSKVHFENGNWQEAANDLQKAKALQMKILNKSGADANINMMDERKIASKICCQLAELHSNRREWNKAIDLYREAISINETDVKSMLALASIFMSMGKLQQCSQMCASVIAIDKNNNEATLMTADLMYQRNEGEQAIKHFSQLLDRNPNHYHALARYIELAWRKGELDQVEKYLKNAVENNPRATVDAGYNYCRGLVEWYTGDPNAALQCFNRSRRDLEWGERAIYNMIEICLNPDNEIIGGEVFDHSSDNPNGDTEREMAAKTAERFLKELRHKPGLDYKYKLMENFIMLSSSNKLNVQQALNNFLELIGSDGSLEGDKNLNVGAILGSARAYMLLKQTPKAKAQLKRVVAYPWSLEDADYLQQCWLLLADLYINQGKSDQATAILRTVLQHNASAIKAYEYMGFLREREQKFADAAANYEGAWRLCRQRNPAIGYKLAYNYLKCRKLFDCIEVCHIILRQFPNYPKIKKEILDKARANIRI